MQVFFRRLRLHPPCSNPLFVLPKQKAGLATCFSLWRRVRDFFGALPCTLASLCSLTTSAKTVHRTVFFRRQVCTLLVRTLFLFCQSKKQASRPAFHFGGELGIRTLGTLRTQHFESSCQNRTWRNLTEDNGKYKNPENAVFSRLSAPVRIENVVKIRVRKSPPISPSSNGFSEKPIRIFDRTERFFAPKSRFWQCVKSTGYAGLHPKSCRLIRFKK